jgi:hypothetical protein
MLDYTEDRMVLEVIMKVVPLEMLGSITSKQSAKAAWEAITLRNVGVDWVRKVKASTLKHEFDAITFNDGETVDEFGTRIGWITNQLAILGFEYMEEEVVRWFLLALPPKFKQIAASIETLLDLEMISVDELIGRLKPSEERINRNGGNTMAALNLTEDELVVRLSSHLKVSGNGGLDPSEGSSSSNNKRGCSHGRGRGRNRVGGRTGGRSTENTSGLGGGNTSHGGGRTGGDIASDECCYCGKRGHWARECRKKNCDKEVHVVQAKDDDEPTLFMASVAVTEPIMSQAHPTAVHLNESCLFVQLGEKGDGDDTCWILDSGATNHMTGIHGVFSKIDLRVRGIVQFGDGSVANIEGHGMILIKSKTRGHKALTGVYSIPCLTANIVSLGQLEEASYKILLHDSLLKPWDRTGALVAKMKRAVNRLYILHLKID